jgi:tetratricopeptide (TPR) repeat protein
MSGPRRAALLVLLTQSGRDAADGAAARVLTEEIRAWIAAGELPGDEDLRALLAEAEALRADAALAGALGSLGHRLGQAGRKGEGSALVRWAEERARAAGDLATASWALEWLGQEAWVRGDLELAARELAAAAATDELRRAPAERTRHLADVARIRLTQGEFERALEEIRGAEVAARASSSPSAARAAAEVHASLLFELGRHREALALCMAPNAPETAPLPRDEVQVRLDTLAADVLADVGRLEAALVHARRAHEIALEPEVRDAAPLLHLEAKLSLGLLLGDTGATAEALALLDQAAAEFARLEDARGSAWAEKNRGYVLFEAGRADEAVPAFLRAWEAGAELGVPELEGLGALGAAESLAQDGENADAALIERALAAAERVAIALHERQTLWRVAALRGRMLLASGAHAAALRELRRSVAAIERWRRRLGASGLVEHALRPRADPYRDAALAAAHLGRMEEALDFACLLQARALDGLGSRRDGPLPAAPPAVAELAEHIARLEGRLRRTPGAVERAGLERELDRAEDELDAALLSTQLGNAPGRARSDGAPPLPELARGLREEGIDAALCTVVGQEETLVLRVDAAPAARLEGRLLAAGRARIERLVARLSTPVDRIAAGELDLLHLPFDAAAARELHDLLVRPLGLASGARVALVPDELLASLPFELLVSDGAARPLDLDRPFAHLAGLRFLAEDLDITRLSSLERATRSLAPRAGELVVFVAPDAVGVPSGRAEAEAVARRAGRARIVADATVADVLRLAPGAGALHFVAHGVLDPERPANGHLVLGGPAAGEGGRLASWQVAALDLVGTRVVLSACHGGRGDWRAGAGLAGLMRGFQLAGAREVVASHWAVDDRVTARLMELLQAELARGQDTPAALRTACARLRRETDPRGFSLAHPIFWAGWFVQR